MENSVRRFDGRVGEYAQYRERYESAVLLPKLTEWCGLTPQWTVADIGAGTGMLSDVFLENDNRVFSVEPNAEMREMCLQLHPDSSRLEIRDGTAEATGLDSSSVEMVTAGRALHWFDVDRAMAEFHRILKPEGWVASIAFGRTEMGREENEMFERLLQRYTQDHANTHAAYAIYRRLGDFLVRDFHHEEIYGSMRLDWDALHGMTMSLSHAPRRNDARYRPFETDLRRYFDQYAVNGAVTWETRYWINVGRLA